MTRKRLLRFALIIQGLVIIILAPLMLLGSKSTSGLIEYKADWDLSNITRHEDGSWTTINDQGYTVTVAKGYIVSYSATMNFCPHSHGLLSSLLGWTMPISVFAGHDAGSIDPAETRFSTVESLTALEPLTWDTVIVEEPAYCEGHYLIARTDETTRNLPDDVDMASTSLFLQGSYQAPGSTIATPFTLHSSLAWGTLKTLVNPDSDSVHVEVGQEIIEITLRRPLESLFDGVDFETMNDTQRATAILRSLMDHTQIIVTGGKAHA